MEETQTEEEGCSNTFLSCGNLRKDKRTLLTVITQLLPYVGYPRSLNAIACLNEVAPGRE